MMSKSCKVCKGEIKRSQKRTDFCSDACYRRDYYDKIKGIKKEEYKASYVVKGLKEKMLKDIERWENIKRR